MGLDWEDYDFQLRFRSDTPVIGGPSAGGEMAVAFTVAMWNLEHPADPWVIDETVAGTGTINADGTIGPVGGIPAKAEAASEAGVETFFYPAGQDVATTRMETESGVRLVAIEMSEWCLDLGISCAPAASLDELLEAAVGIELVRPAVPDPNTSIYADYLEDDVRGQVADLRRNLTSMADSWAADQSDSEREIADLVARIEDLVHEAESSVESKRYYQAASLAFQGRVLLRYGDGLFQLYETTLSRVAVEDSIQGCSTAVDAVEQEVPQWPATDLTAWMAVGEAQHRVDAARGFLASAEQSLRDAYRLTDWKNALHASSLCTERVESARWWADLADRFPPGRRIADADGFVAPVFAQAQEALLYAQAIGVSDGTAAWQAALEYRRDGMLPAATRAATEAVTRSNVGVQTQGGALSPDVVDMAREATARAISQAQAAGTEPVVSVSLAELADEQGHEDALASLWTARSLALLAHDAGGADVEVVRSADGRAWIDWLGPGALTLAVAAMVVVVATRSGRI